MAEPTAASPEVTVVVPTYNRADALGQTLDALARTDLPGHGWEAVVVDDGSTDGTQAAVAARAPSWPAPLRYERQANAGAAAARNRGADLARGRILVFIDNDIVVAPDFVAKHVAAVGAHAGTWIIGRIVHPEELRATPFGRYRDAVWESFHRAAPEGAEASEGMTAANLSLPREDFLRLGGFDTAFTIASCEDADLGIRARQAGIRIVYRPDIVAVHHDWAVSLRSFAERQRLYSVSDVLMWRKYGEGSPRAALVRENAPIAWGGDPPGRVLRKAVKACLANPAGRALLRAHAWLAERLAPDTAWCHRSYELLIAESIFRGVRAGLQRYG